MLERIFLPIFKYIMKINPDLIGSSPDPESIRDGTSPHQAESENTLSPVLAQKIYE